MSSVSQGIVGGTIDSGHEAVAMMYDHSGGYICTGTMVSARVFLTAAHCVADNSDANDYIVLGGKNLNTTDPDWYAEADEVEAHPGYNDQQLIHDVGVIVLKEDAPVTTYRWLDEDDEDVYDEGTKFTLVGFGVTSGSGPDNSGVKRKVELTITEVYSDVIGYGNSQKNGCSGDSGGPALVEIGGKTTVIGITSFGDPNCNQYGYSMRTDDNRTFIDDFAGPNEGDGGSGGGGGGGGSDSPIGCSIAQTSRASVTVSPALLALAALVIARRRR